MVYFAATLLACLYVHCQYNDLLRERWLWLAAPVIAVVANAMFALHVRKMSDQYAVYESSFWYWDISMHAPFIVLPLLFYGVKLTPLCAAGIIFVVIGVVLFHLGGHS